MLQSQFALFLFIIKILLSLNLAQRQLDGYRELRYSVLLSEPLESTLEWDYDGNDETKLFFQWNITLINGYSGLLAFSNYDLKTDHLDVMIFGDDENLYNGYTDEDSFLFLPDNSVQLTYKKKLIEKSVNGKKKKYTIKIIRPLNTCDEEKRNYIIDRGTIHLLTGAMIPEDFPLKILVHRNQRITCGWIADIQKNSHSVCPRRQSCSRNPTFRIVSGTAYVGPADVKPAGPGEID